MEELIRPNWHIALVHFPIALLIVGGAVELLSFLGWRRSTFRLFGRWAILLGAIVAVPVTFNGLYSLGDVVPQGINALARTDPGAAETISDHLWMSAVSAGASMLLVVLWIALSDTWRDRLSIVFKIILLLTVTLLMLAAHHGGEIVYAHKIGPHGTGATSLPTSMPAIPIDQLLDQALQSMQVHTLMAGFAVAMACVCLGWSIRAVTQPVDLRTIDDAASARRIAAAFSNDIAPMNESRQLLGTPAPMPVSINHTPPVRTGRFWMLTLLLLILATGSGIWYLSVNEGTWDVETLRRAITLPLDEGEPGITRRFAHAVAGAVLIGNALLLAVASAVARRNLGLLIVLAVPMILALAAQVWLGVLLVMEGPMGAVTGFDH
jgi:uncharacterized membrane protein